MNEERVYEGFENLEEISRILDNGYNGIIHFRWNASSSDRVEERSVNKLIELWCTYPNINIKVLQPMTRENITILRDILHGCPLCKKLRLLPEEYYPDGLFKTITSLNIYFTSQQVPRLAELFRNSNLEYVALGSTTTQFMDLFQIIQALPPTIKRVKINCHRLSIKEIEDCHWYLMRHPNYTVSWRYGLTYRLNKIILISRILPPDLFRQLYYNEYLQ